MPESWRAINRAASTKVAVIGSDLGVMYANRNDAVEDEEDTSMRHWRNIKASMYTLGDQTAGDRGRYVGIQGQGQHV